jgi:hypothetical protein
MPYHIEKIKNKYYVFDNYNVQLPSHGFKTKKQANKQKIAVILAQSKRQKMPLSYYFG